MGPRVCQTSHLPGEDLLLKVTGGSTVPTLAPSSQHDTLSLVIDRFVRLDVNHTDSE